MFPKSCSCFLHNEKDKNCLLLWISVALHVGVFFSISVHLVLIECSHECKNKNYCYQGFVCIYVCVPLSFFRLTRHLSVLLSFFHSMVLSNKVLTIRTVKTIDYFICCCLFILGQRIKGLFLTVDLLPQ